MSDQAEKLRQRMRKLRDPLKDMKRVAIVGAQAHARVALFSYNLAMAFLNQEGAPLILEEESTNRGEEHLNVLLNLQDLIEVDEKLGNRLFFEGTKLTQSEGVSILSLPVSKLLDQESDYSQLGLFLGKQTPPHQSVFWVQYSFRETNFQEWFDPSCLLIVTKGDPTDLVSAYTIIKDLHSRNKELAIGVVVTQVDNENLALTAYETLNAVSLRFLEKQLVYCGALTKSHGDTTPLIKDWFGRGTHTPTIYEDCRRFISQGTVTT